MSTSWNSAMLFTQSLLHYKATGKWVLAGTRVRQSMRHQKL